MKNLLFQSDDYGITDAVSDGILKGIKEGIIRNTGLFVNMKSSERAAKKIKDVDVCLGVDINLVAGKPVSMAEEVPHLVRKDGNFITSREQINNNQLISLDKIVFNFETDPYPYEEVLMETENQVKRFIELLGRKPEYIHPHSLCTPNTMRAAKEIARKYDLFNTVDMMSSETIKELPGAIVVSKTATLEEQVDQPVEKDFLEIALPSLKDEETGYYITHCGYIDYDLFECSSLTLRRMRDLAMATDPRIKQYLTEHQIKLITYRELPEFVN